MGIRKLITNKIPRKKIKKPVLITIWSNNVKGFLYSFISVCVDLASSKTLLSLVIIIAKIDAVNPNNIPKTLIELLM